MVLYEVQLDKQYPVGAIYLSINNTNPSELFGGEWEQIKDRFLLACGDTYSNGSTGGEATHTLTVNEMPSHNHSRTTTPQTWAERETGNQIISPTSGTSKPVTKNTNNTGGGQAHNNMPPYLAVYVWVRIR